MKGLKPRLQQNLQLTMLLTSFMVLTGVTLYALADFDDLPAVETSREPAPPPMVRVIEVSPSGYRPRLQGSGKAKPRYSMELTSELSGRLEKLTDLLRSGRQVNKGDLLARIDDTQYLRAVASAERQLADARVKLAEERGQSRQARNGWKQSGQSGDAPDLLLRKPQLTAAESLEKEAIESLKVARRDLSSTRITAPFNGVIIERKVSPGQYLQPGDSIATLFSTDQVEIPISLPPNQWSLLPDSKELKKLSATLKNANDTRWEGTVSRLEQHVNSETRQRSLIIEVKGPLEQNPPLLAGSFLKAEIPVTRKDNLLAIPAKSLGGSGDIWFVDQNNRLDRFKADIVFQQNGMLFVKPPADIDQLPLQVVTSALPGYLTGQSVIPEKAVVAGKH